MFSTGYDSFRNSPQHSHSDCIYTLERKKSSQDYMGKNKFSGDDFSCTIWHKFGFDKSRHLFW